MKEAIKSIFIFLNKVVDIIKLLLSILNKLLLYCFIIFCIFIYDKVKTILIQIYNFIPFIDKIDIQQKSIIKTILSSLMVFVLFINNSYCKNTYEIIDNFILKNENNGRMSLKAYNNDGSNTICAGLTYYIVEKKMHKKHKCQLLDKNNKKGGWFCKVNITDNLTLKECKKQNKKHNEYRELFLNKLLTYNDVNYYKIMNKYQKAVAHDIVHNHGTSNKQVKKVFNLMVRYVKNKSIKNTTTLIKEIYNLTYIKHNRFYNGIKNRNNARISFFFKS